MDEELYKSSEFAIFDEHFWDFQRLPNDPNRRKPKQKEENMSYKVGATVAPNPDESVDYKSQHANTFNIKGNIIEAKASSGRRIWHRVTWENGYTDVYPEDYLILCDEERDETTKMDNMYALPLLPGTRVCLNPDGDRYSQLKEALNGVTTGYVINPRMSDEDLINWKTRNRPESVIVTVKFDNNGNSNSQHHSMHLRELLPVEGEATVIQYIMHDGFTLEMLENENSSNFDTDVIVHGYKISKLRYFDDEWRKKIIAGINA